MFEWLENALDWGISEEEFWNMTLSELQRNIASKKRVLIAKQREKASYDYILADMIGRSVARNYNNSPNTFPKINEMYPTLFDDEEIKEKEQEIIDELSIARFKAFANAFNNNFKESEVEEEDERAD